MGERELSDPLAQRRRSSRGAGLAWLISACVAVIPGLACPSGAQQTNPVFVDDSPGAAEALQRAREQVAGGNLVEAARVLQKLLDEEPDRLVSVAGDADLFESVRARVHRELLGNPELLARYRQAQAARAQRELAEGRAGDVERSRLLTPSGLEAARRIAREHLEAGRFEAARLTLDSVNPHPDRAGDAGGAGRRAAELARQLSAYLPREDVRTMAARWALEAGLDGDAPEPIAWPEAAQRVGLSTMDPPARAEVRAASGKPLVSATYASPDSIESMQMERQFGGGPGGPGGAQTARVSPMGRYLRVFPSALGDRVVVSDGRFVTCLDRFTLARLWMTDTGPVTGSATPPDEVLARRRLRGFASSGDGDIASPTLLGDTVLVAVAGPDADPSSRENTDTVAALRLATGEIRWRVALDQIDDSLRESLVRGPIMIDREGGPASGVAVAAARKSAQDQRLVALQLVGFDVATGRVLWRRPIGSAGALPFIQAGAGADAGVVSRGVAYRGDRLGVIAAVEAWTGRPCWVRRVATPGVDSPVTAHTWEAQSPVVTGARVLTLSADGKDILALDRGTGRVVAQRTADRLGSPSYLLSCGDRLVGVGQDRLALTDLDTFDAAPVRLSRRFAGAGIRGRVVALSDRLLVPISEGVAIVDVAEPDAERPPVALEQAGNVLPLGEQLVIVDDARVHSFITWEMARTILGDRMQRDARDPTPAVVFLDLAHRAGQPDLLLGAADAALDSIALDPSNVRNLNQRRRLFEVLRSIAAASLDAPAGRADGRLDGDVLRNLVDRMERAARTPGDRAAHLLARGSVLERESSFAAAAASYQLVLDAEDLASSTWRGGDVTVRAEIEATRRIRSLIEIHGRTVYAESDAAAARALAGLPANADTASVEPLTRRHGASAAAPSLWMRLAEARDRAGEGRGALHAMENALAAAESLPDDPSVPLGAIAGRLVLRLRDEGLLTAAASVLARVRERRPGLALLGSDGALDGAALADELRGRLAAVRRWPRIGAPQSEGAQSLPGWTMLAPLVRETWPTTPNCLVMERDGEIGVWGPAAGADQAGRETGPLVLRWSRPTRERSAEAIAVDRDTALICSATESGPVVERIDHLSLTWRTPPFGTLFKDDAAAERPSGRAPGMSDLIVTLDERTLVLADRAGRAAAFDTATGRTLWASKSPIDRLADAHTAGGFVALLGDGQPRGDTGGGGGPEALASQPLIALLDARTGLVVARLPSPIGSLRWGRLVSGGPLLVGGQNALVSFDPHTGRANWTGDSGNLAATLGVWTIGGDAFVLGNDRSLMMLDLTTGRTPSEPLLTRGRLTGPTGVDAAEIAPDRFAFISSRGMSLFNPAGELVGQDAIAAVEGVIYSRPVEGRILALDLTPAGPGEEGRMVYTLYTLDARSGIIARAQQLELAAPPRRLAALDGRVVLTTGASTVCFLAPADTR